MFLESFKKDGAGKLWLKEDQQYFYRTQRHHFTVKKKYCDFSVCWCGATTFFHQTIMAE